MDRRTFHRRSAVAGAGFLAVFGLAGATAGLQAGIVALGLTYLVLMFVPMRVGDDRYSAISIASNRRVGWGAEPSQLGLTTEERRTFRQMLMAPEAALVIVLLLITV